MLRDKSLIPLSHQHQHALALCVRIDRASPIPEADLGLWLEEVADIFAGEIRLHFGAEESVVFPAAKELGMASLVEELLFEHAVLRESFVYAESKAMSSSELLNLAKLLSSHIRKEERQLFEGMQQRMSDEGLAALGRELETALQKAEQTCILPREETRLRAKKEPE